MIPVHLDPAQVRIGLIGKGRLALRRYEWLRARNCVPQVWTLEPEPEFEAGVEDFTAKHLPSDLDLSGLAAVWIADLDARQAHDIAQRARALGVLVNVEDDLPFCDFHTPAVVQRDTLLVSIGTGGASPAAASYLRKILEVALPQGWGRVLSHLRIERLAMRKNGDSPRDILKSAQTFLSAPEIMAQIAPCGRRDCVLIPRAKDTTVSH
jgi:precorrin-2 dehydrogenase / sirohydrochlorin ferrochelatase